MALVAEARVTQTEGMSTDEMPFTNSHKRQLGELPCPLLAAAPAELSGQCYRAYLGDVGVGVGAGDLEG